MNDMKINWYAVFVITVFAIYIGGICGIMMAFFESNWAIACGFGLLYAGFYPLSKFVQKFRGKF